MTEPGIAVTLTEGEYSLDELEAFIAAARAVNGIPQNALVVISHEIVNGLTQYTLSASTEYRSK